MDEFPIELAALIAAKLDIVAPCAPQARNIPAVEAIATAVVIFRKLMGLDQELCLSRELTRQATERKIFWLYIANV